MAMALSGKYRTFLSATEKIVAVKYKLEPIWYSYIYSFLNQFITY
jgi:hypothetical protein